MAPLAENYNDPRLIERTETELKRKAEDKGKRYYGIPHTSTRWHMIAGNVMLEMIAEESWAFFKRSCRHRHAAAPHILIVKSLGW